MTSIHDGFDIAKYDLRMQPGARCHGFRAGMLPICCLIGYIRSLNENT